MEQKKQVRNDSSHYHCTSSPLVRIKGRLRNLIARRPQVEQLKKSGIIQGIMTTEFISFTYLLPIESVFGCELAHLTEREQGTVPKFMIHFMDHIEKKGLDTVGLYRLSGNAAQVQKLRYLVEQGKYLQQLPTSFCVYSIISSFSVLFQSCSLLFTLYFHRSLCQSQYFRME